MLQKQRPPRRLLRNTCLFIRPVQSRTVITGLQFGRAFNAKPVCVVNLAHTLIPTKGSIKRELPKRKGHWMQSSICFDVNLPSYRGVEQLVARRAHNPKVVGSSPASATKKAS